MFPLQLTDDLGGTHRFDSPPRRIVSLVPSLTETVVELGGREQLVGVTKWCVHPRGALADITKIGGTKNPSIDTVLGLEPDLILANHEENRERHVVELRKHVPVFLTYPRTVRGALKTVADMGALLDQVDRADAVIAECNTIIGDLRRSGARPLRTACMIWRDPWMAAGQDTYVSDLLHACGFSNVFGAYQGRYPETSLKEVIAHEPDVVLLPDEPFVFDEGHKHEVEAALMTDLPDCHVVLHDGSYLSWFGTRTRLGLRDLTALRRALAESSSQQM